MKAEKSEVSGKRNRLVCLGMRTEFVLCVPSAQVVGDTCESSLLELPNVVKGRGKRTRQHSRFSRTADPEH